MSWRAQLNQWVDDALGGRWGVRVGRGVEHMLGMKVEPRAAVMARAGRLDDALQLLDGRRSLKALGRRVHARCRDSIDFLASPLPAPAPARARGAGFNGRVLYALHSCGSFDPSGYASRSQALIGAVRARGIEAIAATRLGYPWDLLRHRGKPRLESSQYGGIDYLHQDDPAGHIFGADTDYIAAYARHLIELAARHRPAVIHAASNYLDGSAAVHAARSLGLPVVYEMRGLWHLTRTVREPAYSDTCHYAYCERREIAACLLADRVLVLSEPMRAWLVSHGVPAARIDLLGNAADAMMTPATASECAAARASFEIAAGTTVLGYAGAFAAYEGIDTLIASAARLPPERDVQVLLAGSGSEEARLRAAIDQHGVAARVRLLGRLPAERMRAFHAACDAIVLPRLDHPLTRMVPALKPFEAAAWGVPVFVSPALGLALQGTLEGIITLQGPLDTCVEQVLHHLAANPAHARNVPTWADRAAQLETMYHQLCA